MTKKIGADLLVQQIMACDIDTVFGITGSTEVPFISVLNNYYPKLQYKYGLNETVVAGMAKGWAIEKNKPAFMVFHCDLGPGLATSVLFDMKYDYVPGIVYIGMRATYGQSQQSLLQGDTIIDVLKPIAKRSFIVENTNNIPMIIRESYVLSLTPPRGIVVVGIPIDLLENKITSSSLNIITRPPKLYFNNSATTRAIDSIINVLLSSTTKSVFLMGPQIISDSVANSCELAKITNSSIFTTNRLYNYDPFNTNHPNFKGALGINSESILEFFQRQEIIISFGMRNSFLTIIGASESLIKLSTKVIIITNDASNTDQPFFSNAIILADPNKVITDLLKKIKSDEIIFPSRKLEKPFSYKDLIIAPKFPVSPNVIPPDTIEPVCLVRSIVSGLNNNSTLILGDFTYDGVFQNIVPFEFSNKNISLYISSGNSLLGTSIPMAIGMKIANPKLNIVVVCGDGSALITIQSIWSIVHECAPIIFIIINNFSFQEISSSTVTYEQESCLPVLQPVGQQIYYPIIDFIKLSSAFGVNGCKVYNARDLTNAIIEAQKHNKPYLIEVIVKKINQLPLPEA